MAEARDPFGMALDGVRSRLRRGELRPGAALVVGDLAAALKVSVTPVREALCRLTGEGLVEERRGRGFYAAGLEAEVLEELFWLHGAYVDLALQARSRRREAQPRAPIRFMAAQPQAERQPGDGARLAADVEVFWSELVKAGRHRAMTSAYLRVSDRLAVVRLAEIELLGDVREELEGLQALSLSGDVIALQSAAFDYHSRRQGLIEMIATFIYARDG